MESVSTGFWEEADNSSSRSSRRTPAVSRPQTLYKDRKRRVGFWNGFLESTESDSTHFSSSCDLQDTNQIYRMMTLQLRRLAHLMVRWLVGRLMCYGPTDKITRPDAVPCGEEAGGEPSFYRSIGRSIIPSHLGPVARREKESRWRCGIDSRSWTSRPNTHLLSAPYGVQIQVGTFDSTL